MTRIEQNVVAGNSRAVDTSFIGACSTGRRRIATVTNIVVETDDCRSIEFEVDQPQTFMPKPGQVVMVRASIDGELCERPYAVSSLVIRGDMPQITVKRVLGGQMSTWMHEVLRPGMSFEISEPFGMSVPVSGERPLTFMAAGIGLAPILPMLKECVLYGKRNFSLMLFDADESKVAFLKNVRHYVRLRSERSRLEENYLNDGYVPQSALVERLSSAIASDIYVCGPPGFMQLASSAAEEAGIPPDCIYTNAKAVATFARERTRANLEQREQGLGVA